MHIAQYTNFYHPVVNGVVRSVASYRKALSRLGHNVFVFAQSASDYEDDEPFIFRYPALQLPRLTDIAAAIPIAPYLDRILPALKIDVIHTHHPFLLGQVAANKADELGVPLVFTFHTRYRDYTHYFPLPQDFVQEFIKTAVDSWLGDFMERCHHIIVPSESMRQILEEGYGLTEHVTVIPTGIDLAPYSKGDRWAERHRRGWGDEPVLISVGRLAPEKNMETLIRAAAEVITFYPDLRVVLVGDGPSRADLEDLTHDLRIAHRVEFLGKVEFDQIPALLQAADLFGFASVTETQGLVTMEALAAGLPVAAVDASGTRDVVVNGITGVLTDQSSHALARGMLSLLDHPGRMAAFHQEAIQHARLFDIHYLANRMVELYAAAIEDRRAGRRVQLQKPRLFNIDWKFFPTLSSD